MQLAAEFKTRARQIQRVLWITLFLNLFVAACKLSYGHYSNTLSMVADGFHSLIDGSSNVVGLVAIYFSAKPADSDHPYGHRKIEALAAMAISALLFISCYEIVMSAYMRLHQHSAPEVTFYSFLIMLGTMAINFGVSRYEHRRGHELHSQVLTADATHTRSDIFSSLSVIIALIAAHFRWTSVDMIAAIFIGLSIGYSGYKIVLESLGTLMDSAQLDPDKIIQLALSVPGVKKCHDIRTRGHATAIYMDLNIHVDPEIHLEKAHQLTHQVIAKIKENLPQVVDVVVHTEPSSPHDD